MGTPIHREDEDMNEKNIQLTCQMLVRLPHKTSKTAKMREPPKDLATKLLVEIHQWPG
jgi:hypothetical protein